MTMTSNEKRMMEREALRSVIQQWNANRLDLFELSEPDENLQFHGVMRFYFQDAGQKVATKCIRVASDATVSDVIETLVEKFRPDMRMLTLPNYALYEVHSNHEERKLNGDEKPLLVQLNWHIDDREGRFLLKNIDQKTHTLDNQDTIFKRKLSKREKKEQKKKEKLAKLQSNSNDSENHVAERLYTELPETSFTRSISNPEAVMRRRRQQKLEKKLQQFRSRDGGPDTGGTLKIYGESLCRDVPYKTLLLSIRDCAQAVVREMLAKYGMDKADPLQFCLVQVNSDATEYILDDDECPLSILMNHPTSRGSIMFHVRRKPADTQQQRRRKKKPLGLSNGNTILGDREGPILLEITNSGDGGRRIKLGSEPIEVGSANTNTIHIFGPSIQSRHGLISLADSICTVTPLHTDALTFVNGHHIQQSTILHNGSVVMFGRVASYRFIDSPSDGRYNLALSQSQLDSACLYESRSPASPSWHEEDRPLSPVHSVAQAQTQNPKTGYLETVGDLGGNRNLDSSTAKSFDLHNNNHHHHHPGQVNNNLLDDQSSNVDESKSLKDEKRNDSFEVPYDVDGNTETETKSISSVKSSGSNQDSRSVKMMQAAEQGQEPILPAVLEFPETHQDAFLRHVISELDVNAPSFKLAPVYTLYLCARYRASTHYRPDLQPTERANKLTVFLHHVANLILNVVQDQYTDPKILSFWMANSSEFLHFLKSDRHISAFSVQAQEVLAESVQTAFRNLLACFRAELSQTLSQFISENIEHEAAATLVLQVLGSAMALLRRCRVNAALTIQLFSELFHFINVVSFNKIVTTTYMCTAEWGKLLEARLQLLELWAERQGLELAADCHLTKINQCAKFLQAPKLSAAEVQQLAYTNFKLNSLQMAALLSQESITRNLVDTAVRMAESVADELIRADGREIRLEESPELPFMKLLLPDDGFSCEVVRTIPPGLADFLSPLQGVGMCRLAAQPTSIGLWTVYMHQFNGRSPSAMSSKMQQPEIQIIKLQKNSNGMGLSIVAAKGAGQERLGIYIKSVVAEGAADIDGRLTAGDQLLRVDGQSLIGITQEKAAEYLVRTGPVVTLEVAKQGAIYHGLATLLQQPSPVIQRGNRRMSERDISRVGTGESKPPLPLPPHQQLPNSKSVPALHHVGNIAMAGNKSRSSHNLMGNQQQQPQDQGFYQNLSVYRAQNQSQPNLGERSQMPPNAGPTTSTLSNPQMLSRPASAYFTSNNSNTLPSQNSMSQYMLHQPNHNINTNNPNLSNNNNPNISTMSAGSGGLLQNQQQQLAASSTNLRPKQQQQNFTGQQNMRMNQMMAPSMPNIAHSSGYATNISASQSMQNVNMITQNTMNIYPHGPNQQQQLQHQQMYQQNDPQQQQRLMRGQAKLAEMGEEVKRRQQRQQQQDQIGTMDNISLHSQSMSAMSSTGGMSPMMLSPNGQQKPNMKPMIMTQQQHQQQQQQQQYGQPSGMNYHSGPPPHNSNPMSSVKQLPPTTAPKPNRIVQDHDHQQHQQQLPPVPPTQTHPLFKTGNPAAQQPNPNYVANTVHTKNPSNPWDREDREKEHDIRRDQIRQWRDLQISELSNQSHRTPQQDEQLKTLVMEKDFERRAAQEAADNEQEDDNDSNYTSDNVHEMIRLTQPSNQTTTQMTTMKQADVKINTNYSDDGQSNFTAAQQQQQMLSPTSTMQPKSILKHNSRATEIVAHIPISPSKQGKSASFADERNAIEQVLPPPHQHMNHLNKEMTNMNLNNDQVNTEDYQLRPSVTSATSNPVYDQQQQPSQNYNNNINNNTSIPPPPPERNSSYVIMSQQQQQKLRTSTLPNMKPTLPDPTNKRMSSSTLSNNNNLINNNISNNIISSTSSINNNLNNNLNGQNMMMNMTNQQQQQSPLQLSSAFVRDSKRVSFHDEDNNFIGSLHQQQLLQQQQQQQQQHLQHQMNLTAGLSVEDQAEIDMIREDQNTYITDPQSMLDSPMTPDTEAWNLPIIQSTPGVIGAQEVYRDPRQRRLQEKLQAQQQQKTGEVPEKLSFKEKMKMFALESGEDQSPKDKLKISRAQRDIDAVH